MGASLLALAKSIYYGKVIYRFSQGQKRSSRGNWLAEKTFSKPAITWFYNWSAENLKNRHLNK